MTQPLEAVAQVEGQHSVLHHNNYFFVNSAWQVAVIYVYDIIIQQIKYCRLVFVA